MDWCALFLDNTTENKDTLENNFLKIILTRDEIRNIIDSNNWESGYMLVKIFAMKDANKLKISTDNIINSYDTILSYAQEPKNRIFLEICCIAVASIALFTQNYKNKINDKYWCEKKDADMYYDCKHINKSIFTLLKKYPEYIQGIIFFNNYYEYNGIKVPSFSDYFIIACIKKNIGILDKMDDTNKRYFTQMSETYFGHSFGNIDTLFLCTTKENTNYLIEKSGNIIITKRTIINILKSNNIFAIELLFVAYCKKLGKTNITNICKAYEMFYSYANCEQHKLILNVVYIKISHIQY